MKCTSQLSANVVFFMKNINEKYEYAQIKNDRPWNESCNFF